MGCSWLADFFEGFVVVERVVGAAVGAGDEAFGAAVCAGAEGVDIPFAVSDPLAGAVGLGQTAFEVAEVPAALVAGHGLIVFVHIVEHFQEFFGRIPDRRWRG